MIIMKNSESGMNRSSSLFLVNIDIILLENLYFN